MKKSIKTVDKARGILQVTTLNERYYAIPTQDEAGLPTYRYIPSVTWIAGFYPKGIAFYKWLADKGWDESQSIKSSAGDKGSKVHHAIHELIKGEEVKCTDVFENSSGVSEELTIEEWQTIDAFARWVREVKPKFIRTEFTVFTENYAGTIDAVVEIDGKIYIVDWKTSQYIWTEYELQISAYKNALEEEDRLNKRPKVDYALAILQVGYAKNRKGWKWNVLDDKYELFKHAQAIWANENDGKKPKQIELPLSIKL